MKRVTALLLLAAIVATTFASCASSKTGCPGVNFYSKQDRAQTRRAQHQKTLF
ncbi:hypothetical protein [Chitinophaga parva]|uniref:hypothetical protein n=1 Tax=Chitinophaga parva TaxID=2169414 RepID=UPI0014041D92|nr:hypothetical protein [Chitinophaga parva]